MDNIKLDELIQEFDAKVKETFPNEELIVIVYPKEITLYEALTNRD